MLPFCEPGDEYTVPWVGGGFSRCFLQIVGSISTAGLLYLFGLSAIVLAPKPKKELKAGDGKSLEIIHVFARAAAAKTAVIIPRPP